MKRNKYNYIKNKTFVEGWNHLIKDAQRKNTCLETKSRFLDKNGYAMFKFNKKSWRANRFAYTANWGEIPKGMFVCHHCDNPKCIEPRHLWLGTPLENMQDRDKKGRHKIAHPDRTKHIGESNGSSKLNTKQILEIRRNYIPHSGSSFKYSKSNQRQLAKKYNVSVPLIRAIANRQIWKHI